MTLERNQRTRCIVAEEAELLATLKQEPRGDVAEEKKSEQDRFAAGWSTQDPDSALPQLEPTCLSDTNMNIWLGVTQTCVVGLDEKKQTKKTPKKPNIWNKLCNLNRRIKSSHSTLA